MANGDCGWCGCLVQFEAATALITSPNFSGWGGGVRQAAYLCRNCKRLVLAYEGDSNYHSKDVQYDNIRQSEEYRWSPYSQWLPKQGERRDFSDVPDHIAAAAGEAVFCLNQGAYRAAGSLARAVVESTCKDCGSNGKNLEGRINALAQAGHIRPHTKEQAHEIRHFGNDMAHGDFASAVSKEEAAEIIELMAEVLNEVYQSPAKLRRVKSAREAKKAEQKDDAKEASSSPLFSDP